jgi:hypothetical protein
MTTHPVARRAVRLVKRRRPPAFVPVPLRHRADGWTPWRQARFLGVLAETGSVAAAARAVGLARETAYRLRRRAGAESFAAAWDAVLSGKAVPARKVTTDELRWRAYCGVLKPVMRAGRHVGTLCKPDNSALLRLLARLGRPGAEGPRGAGEPAKKLSRECQPEGAREAGAAYPLPNAPRSAHLGRNASSI